jgi:HK97 gp10 family phage protein
MVTERIAAVPEKASSIMAEIGNDALEMMQGKTPVWKGKPDRSHIPGKLKEGDTLEETGDGFKLSNAVKYAKFVNYGTRKMEAEPFLDPAVEFAAQAMADRLPQALEE